MCMRGCISTNIERERAREREREREREKVFVSIRIRFSSFLFCFREIEELWAYLTQSVFKVVLQKSTPPQIR